jgi:hypothetical protein
MLFGYDFFGHDFSLLGQYCAGILTGFELAEQSGCVLGIGFVDGRIGAC